MKTLTPQKKHSTFTNLDQLGVSELNKKEATDINGGSIGAVLAGVALVGGAFVVGVAIGVGVYYGVKALTN